MAVTFAGNRFARSIPGYKAPAKTDYSSVVGSAFNTAGGNFNKFMSAAPDQGSLSQAAFEDAAVKKAGTILDNATAMANVEDYKFKTEMLEERKKELEKYAKKDAAQKQASSTGGTIGAVVGAGLGLAIGGPAGLGTGATIGSGLGQAASGFFA
tara:strand:- start:493 stop:954 length:462 start_codon:yes stop_codon:yes gene_type:complete